MGTKSKAIKISEGTIYLVRLYSPGATSLGVYFEQFHLPRQARLYMYDSGRKVLTRGPYTFEKRRDDGTAIISELPGSSAVLELFIPNQTAKDFNLKITEVNIGFE